MLDINFIKENIDLVKDVCKNKNLDLNIDLLVELDEANRQRLVKIETLRAKRNEISDRMKDKRDDDLINQSKLLKTELEKLEQEQAENHDSYKAIYDRVPNIASKDTPIGSDSEQNVVIKTVGNIPKFNFPIKDHIQLGKDLDIIDFEKGTKAHGSRGYYLKNEGALLHMA
jgi:seryl-tRNA synthetase